ALASQIYAMGGMVTQLHFQASRPGRSLGENNMYNGDGFHTQRFTAIAMPPAQFQAWVDNVKNTGIPLNDKTYAMVARQGTRTQLAAALPQAPAQSGDIYFKGVAADLFPAVVQATKKGIAVTP